MKSQRIRAGLYEVSFPNGNSYSVDNRQSPPEWGSEWLWYINDLNGNVWFDPCYTKAEALDVLRRVNA
jgi:hypothetical protein